MSEDILTRLKRLQITGKIATAKDITDAINQIESYHNFCRHLDRKRKEISDILSVATRLMEYQEYPK